MTTLLNIQDQDETLDPFFAKEREGVRIDWDETERQLTVDWIEDHIVHGAIFEPKTYFDYIWSSSLQWLYQENQRKQADLADLKRLEEENRHLKEQLALSKHTIFGTSSEQSAAQPDAPIEIPSAELDQTVDRPACKPRLVVNNAGRKKLPEHIPRESIHYRLPPEKLVCTCCNGKLHEVGEEMTERLTVIPAQYKVIQHIRHKYVCRKCEEFTVAPVPESMIPGSSYGSAEFLADVSVKRFQHGLPYYRQEAILNQSGLPFNRTTLANSMIRCADKMTALYELLKDELRGQDIIHADETVFQVLKEPGRNAQTNSYLWQYRSNTHSTYPVVMYEYQPTRSGAHPRNFLAGDGVNRFRGYLCVDGYAGYNNIPDVIRVGCMAHVRRKFKDAIKSLPGNTEHAYAQQAIKIIGKLYAVEHRLAKHPPQTRYKARQEESSPILHELKQWLDDMTQKVLPKSLLGKAIHYALDQWQAVSRYIEDGRLAIDNNIAEREIKAFVIGRKNWLFADSVDGAYANAVMYTLVQTAKANGLDPYKYLLHIFEQMPSLKTSKEVKSLLPWNVAQGLADQAILLAA